MEIYNAKQELMPLNKRILVYACNIDKPGWYIDEFTQMGPSDHYQLNGTFYPSNISHWAYLPKVPID